MSEHGLIVALQQCRDLLRRVGEDFWADKLTEALPSYTLELSVRDIREILSWFGGMGSLSDLVVSSKNGHNVNPDDEKRCNSELGHLRDIIYEESKKLLEY
ncbi:hypothetical protein D6779_09090 [Candidatus Parcubacteria bacterium]|nr:MAG: hypothetical protein D6779_09090 [Candidatus Parcubacteria bacterium]